MKIIIDSGSTKAEIGIIEKNNISNFSIIGINPFFIHEESINEFATQIKNKINPLDFNEVYFYGTGCFDNTEKDKINAILSPLFKNASIEINTDLLGAARSIFNKHAGIIAILGTGANTGTYNGNAIKENIRPLGYVLGDEGSGAWFGKQLIMDYFHDKMPETLKPNFSQNYLSDKDEVLRKLYSENFPNRFLASYFPFIEEHLKNTYIKELCNDGINKFFNCYINPYQRKDLPIGFVGSVAYSLKNKLQEIAEKNHYQLTEIIQSPIEGLIQFHKNE